jgi:Tol biopolymer transport system component
MPIANCHRTKKVTRRSALGQNRWISWAPDGRRIAFSGTQPGARKGDIFVVDAEGGNPHSSYPGTTNNVQPAWWPAGDQFAFLATPMAGVKPTRFSQLPLVGVKWTW